ncbi:MAG: CHAT domain-containing tetratricopeptide repeat protein [Bacteroidota bacterium]
MLALALLVLIGRPDNVLAQSAKAQFETALNFLEKDEIEKGLSTLETAKIIALEEGDTITFLEANLKLGNQLIREGNYAASAEAFREGLAEAEKNKWPNNETIGNHWHKFGVTLYLERNLAEAITAYQQAVEVRTLILGPNDLNVARSNHNIGSCYELMKDPDNAIAYYQKGLDIRKLHDVPDDQAYSYLRIGANYTEKEDYTKGLEYLEPALQIYLKLYGEIDEDVAETYNLIGIAQFLRKEYDLAIEAYEQALIIYQHPDLEIIEGQTNALNNIGGAYFEAGETQKALDYYQRSMRLNQKMGEDNLDGLADNYTNIGLCYSELGQFRQAKNYLKKALETSKTLFGEIHPEHAYHYDNLAGMYYDNLDSIDALSANTQGIASIVANFSETDLFGLPDIQSDQIIGSKRLLLTLLSNRALYLDEFAKSSTERVQACFQTIDQLIDLMRQEQSAKGSKLFWTEEALPIYERAVVNSLKEPQFRMDQAFYFMEKSKSILLLESLKESNARKFAGLSDDLLEKEANLKENIIQTEQALFALQLQENPDSNALISTQEQLLEERSYYDGLIQELETNHPAYYQMKYDFSSIDRAELGRVLPSETGLVEYLVGDKGLYIYYHFNRDKLSGDSMIIRPLDEELSEKVSRFRASIYGYFLGSDRSDTNYQLQAETYIRLGQELYAYLLGDLPDLPDKLIIIPDGVLGYLPFDALLTEAPQQATRFKSHPYLIRKHQISYSYSANLLQEMLAPRNRSSNHRLLAFAPSFSGNSTAESPILNRASLKPLLHNQEEVKAIKKMIGGKLFLGQEATEAQFREMGSQYSILHFATHGKANDEAADYSYLAFAEIADSTENEFLFVHDLYSMELNADMAVLSACETGTGKLYRGEGIMSLARGFSYAGVPSIVTTLWSVNDAKTSELMQGFYAELNDDADKTTALQRAKLMMIQNSSDDLQAHPFYWSGAILIGDPSPIHLQHFPYVWLFGLVVLVLFGLAFYQRKRKK